jgi:hypothetical protein
MTLALATNSPALVLLALVASVTSLTARRLALDLAVSAAALLLLLGAVAAGQVAARQGLNLLAHPRLLAATYLVAAGAALLHAMRRDAGGPPSTSLPAAPWWRGLAFLPVAVATVTGLAQVAVTGLTKSWGFWGTDLARHMAAIGSLQSDGRLDYGTSSYPRGLHMLAALVSVPDPPLTDASRLLGYDAVLAAALTWFALALLLLAGTSLALRAADRLGWGPAVGTMAAVLLGGGALLTNTFLLSFVYLGAAPSLAAVAVLYGVPLAHLVVPRTAHQLAFATLVSALSAVALAHLWQALLAAPVLAWVVLALPELHGLPGALRSRLRRRMLMLAGAGALGAAALAFPPVFEVQRAAGLAYAAVPGELAGPPWRLLGTGVLALVVLLVWRRRETWVRAAAGTALGLALATYLLLRGTGHPHDLTQYYPMKAAWFLALFLAPLLAVVVAGVGVRWAKWLWSTLGRTGRYAVAGRTLAAGLVLGPFLAAWLGYLVGVDAAALGAWDRAVPAPAGDQRQTTQLSAVRYDIAVRFASTPGRVVVPWQVGEAPFDRYGTRTISILLTALTGQPEIRGGQSLCREIDWVAQSRSRPALVVTQLPVRTVEQALRKSGCPGRAEAVRVPLVGYRD